MPKLPDEVPGDPRDLHGTLIPDWLVDPSYTDRNFDKIRANYRPQKSGYQLHEIVDIFDRHWDDDASLPLYMSIPGLRAAMSVVADRRRLLSDLTNNTETPDAE